MSPTRGRPATVPVKKLIAMDAELLTAIEAFRADQPQPPPNQSEAIRILLRDHLVGLGYLPPER